MSSFDQSSSFRAAVERGPDSVGPTRRTVLIVDDDRATARAIEVLLDRAGYDASACYNGGEAMKRVRQERPSALLIDVHLKDVSGLVLAQQVRQELGPEVPIIMVSGDTSMETLNSLPHVGATYFLSKPMNADTLVQHVRQWLS